jgi:5-methylcytosine-specific restriction endonuclease McrA
VNYYPFHIGEPWQSELNEAFAHREAATTSAAKSRANAWIRSVRLQAARAKGTHTESEWLRMVSAFQCRCVMCGAQMEASEIQKDHIIPIYQGGSDGIENLQPLCRPCNTSKGPDTFDWVSYRVEHGFEGCKA